MPVFIVLVWPCRAGICRAGVAFRPGVHWAALALVVLVWPCRAGIRRAGVAFRPGAGVRWDALALVMLVWPCRAGVRCAGVAFCPGVHWAALALVMPAFVVLVWRFALAFIGLRWPSSCWCLSCWCGVPPWCWCSLGCAGPRCTGAAFVVPVFMVGWPWSC